MSDITKICGKCGTEKPIEEFAAVKGYKEGRCSWCKSCKREYGRQYYYANKEKMLKYGKEWFANNKDHARERLRQWRKKNPESDRKYYEMHKEACKLRTQKWVTENPDKVKAIRGKAYAKKDKTKRNEMLRVQRLNNPAMRINASISSLIRRSLRDGKHGRSWESLVGYNVETLMAHLEAQFKPGMTWDNYGEWHIDHIVPLSIFNITDEKSKGFKKAWGLLNLRPLWAGENMSKHKKLFAA